MFLFLPYHLSLDSVNLEDIRDFWSYFFRTLIISRNSYFLKSGGKGGVGVMVETIYWTPFYKISGNDLTNLSLEALGRIQLDHKTSNSTQIEYSQIPNNRLPDCLFLGIFPPRIFLLGE